MQPFIAKKLAHRRARLGTEAGQIPGSILLWLAVALTGVYGGYFGAAQGVLLIAILGIGLVGSLPLHQCDQERAGDDRQQHRGGGVRDRQ